MGEGEQIQKSMYTHTNMVPDSSNIKPVWTIQIRNRQFLCPFPTTEKHTDQAALRAVSESQIKTMGRSAHTADPLKHLSAL